jgi:transcriptional regulator with XRE-family HTH domain
MAAGKRLGRSKSITCEVMERGTRYAILHVMTSIRPVGEHLREWRQRRRMSQLDLAGDAEISTRHLSFLETGRSLPSREMILNLAERLEIPLRERNVLLTAAGYAPLFPQRPLDDPALRSMRRAIDFVLKGHEPYPALAVDRHWTMVTHNAAVPALIAGVDAALLRPPVNVLRLSLHPSGLAPRILNLAQWRAHLVARLRRQVEITADALLAELLGELLSYRPSAGCSAGAPVAEETDVVVPLRLKSERGELSLFSTTTVFGTPVDVTLSELAVESFFPANAVTAERLRELHDSGSGRQG